MEKLTNEIRRYYLSNGGAYCPFCHSDEIEATDNFDFDGSMVFENIICYNCKREWTDEYTLTGITVLEED